MPLASSNQVTVSTGTSDWIPVYRGQTISAWSSGWNSASAAMMFMPVNDTGSATTLKDSAGAITWTANNSTVAAADGYVYAVVTGTASSPINLAVTGRTNG